jgi:hypothetical protein
LITKTTELEKKLKLEQEIGVHLNDLGKKKGFKNIFDAIIKKKSVLIGHNCHFDILFVISHFGDSLPNTLKDFKSLVKSYFSE